MTAKFAVHEDVVLYAQPGFLPVSLVDMEAADGEPAQYWFTEVPVDDDPERIETPDDVIVPTAWSRDGLSYTFMAALVDMRDDIEASDVALLVHGAPPESDPIVVGFIMVPWCS